MKRLLTILILLLPIICFGQRNPAIAHGSTHLSGEAGDGRPVCMDDGNLFFEFEAADEYMTYFSGGGVDCDSVTQWADISGNDRHMIQGTSSRMPRFDTDSVFFDGTEDFISFTASEGDTLEQPFTVYIVFKYHTHSGDALMAMVEARDNNTCRVALDDVGVGSIYTYAGTSQTIDSTITLNDIYVLTWVCNGASTVISINDWDGETVSAGNNDLDGFMLGQRRQADCFADYSVYYLIGREGADSSEDQASIRSWLNTKYSIY